MNKIIISGNTTQDINLNYVANGLAVANMSMASNRNYKKQDGSKSVETCFITVRILGRMAEVANQYINKGSKILVEGRLIYETWKDQMGNTKSRHVILAEKIEFLDTKKAQVVASMPMP